MEQPTDLCERLQRGLEMKETLYPQQLDAYSAIEKAFLDEYEEDRYFFIDGPAGSGKSYLWETLDNVFTGMGKTIVNTAWTGLAASLLSGGRTVCSQFHLPVPVKKGVSSGIEWYYDDAKKLIEADAIFWDQISMSPKYALEAVDELLRKITGFDRSFGNKIIILKGDFRQILPIVQGGNNQDRIDCCVTNSPLWELFHVLSLARDMSAQDGTGLWQQFLLRVGNGMSEKDETFIALPSGILSAGDLVEEVFGSPVTAEQIGDRAILTPTKAACDQMNELVLKLMPGDALYYRVTDAAAYRPKQDQNTTVQNDYQQAEFVRYPAPQMMPPDNLKLKVGAPIMLLRNLDINNGLCNGTRLIFEGMKDEALICEIAAGPRRGEKAAIRRIRLESSTNSSPCRSRWQFPVKLCFAMTIDKSQGQKFERVGLYLPVSVFSHGHLYVAFSRVRNMNSIKVLIGGEDPSKTKSIVYPEILREVKKLLRAQ